MPEARTCVLLLALACVAPSLVAQERMSNAAPEAERYVTSGIVPLPGVLWSRQRVSLDGAWGFIVDAVDRGLRRGAAARYAIPRDERQVRGDQLVEYSWDDAPQLRVPGDWNTQTARTFWYEGLGWYRRRLPLPADTAGRRYFLYFEGANYLTHVFLNATKLGVHEGGFTPFGFEVTGKLRADNSLVVGVNSRRLADGVPVSDADWFLYGGITRPVWLVSVPQTFVRVLHAALRETPEGDRIEGRVVLDGPARARTPVRLSIAPLGVSVTLAPDTGGVAVFSVRPRNLRRWSPDQPQRYDVVAMAGADTVRDQVGFRTIATRGTDILLNGRSIYLRGISMHEEAIGNAPDQGTRTLDAASARRLLVEAKALGANFVRLAHYPHSGWMTGLADSLGLLVWSEIPVYQNDIQYSNPLTLATARRMQAANIERDYNRASVIVWSVANETPINDARNAFLRTLITDVRTQDPTRLVSAALNRSADTKDPLEIRIDDPLGEALDLLAYNTYVGWYGAYPPDSIRSTRWTTPYTKPLILSEFGADAKAGNHGDFRDRWTEEHQAWFYRETLAMADGVPWLRGMSPWILKDFRSPRRYHGKFQEYWNRKGLISETGERKIAFDTLAAFYRRKAVADGAK